jgi:hypothetical protein
MTKVLIKKNIYVDVKEEDPSESCADPKIFLGSRNQFYGSRRHIKENCSKWVENRCLRPEGRIKIQSGSRTPIVTPHKKIIGVNVRIRA